jgi:prepilin-type N-terminal cleavage/methylation domain-containing protein
MRSKGFSLVELLIVLSVMAALIAAMIPIGMNAIRKSKAVKVARNLKCLAETAQNIIMIDGVNKVKDMNNLSDYVENITEGYQLRIFDSGLGTIKIYSLYTKTDVSTKMVSQILPGIQYLNEPVKITLPLETDSYYYFDTTKKTIYTTGDITIVPKKLLNYSITISVY